MGGLEGYTTWLELWVFLCFRVQRERPLFFLHQYKETISYHRRLGKGHVSPLMIAWGGGRVEFEMGSCLISWKLGRWFEVPIVPWYLFTVISLGNAGHALRDLLSTWLQTLVGLLQKVGELTD